MYIDWYWHCMEWLTQISQMLKLMRERTWKLKCRMTVSKQNSFIYKTSGLFKGHHITPKGIMLEGIFHAEYRCRPRNSCIKQTILPVACLSEGLLHFCTYKRFLAIFVFVKILFFQNGIIWLHGDGNGQCNSPAFFGLIHNYKRLGP